MSFSQNLDVNGPLGIDHHHETPSEAFRINTSPIFSSCNRLFIAGSLELVY